MTGSHVLSGAGQRLPGMSARAEKSGSGEMEIKPDRPRVIKTDLPTIETVRASLIFSSHPGAGTTHHLLCIRNFR